MDEELSVAILEEVVVRPQTEIDVGAGREAQGEQEGRHINVGRDERAASVAAGSIVALLGLSRGSLPGLLMAGLGGALIYRGATGHCSVYEKLNMDSTGTRAGKEAVENGKGLHAEAAFLVNRSAEDCYRFWRDFERLPTIMRHLESVKVLDDKRSHWVASAKHTPGGKLEWDAEITRDQPNEAIAWQSLPGADVESAGEIRFSKALGDRGTEVHVFMDYWPPAGKIGEWTATLFGAHPRRLLREDLRNFKRIINRRDSLTGRTISRFLHGHGPSGTRSQKSAINHRI